ncbi:MAG: hypothetical protein ACK587_17010 [Cyanobacteriota bacterium]|jgi:hypothetical protein
MSPAPRLWSALAAAALGLGGALLVAGLLALVLAPLSVDQPLEPEELLGWGTRWGGVMAVALGAGAALGPTPPAGPRGTLRVMALTAAGVLALCLGAAALAVLAVRLGWWARDWQIPHRSGHAARLVALRGAWLSGLPAAALAGWSLVRQRRGGRHG